MLARPGAPMAPQRADAVNPTPIAETWSRRSCACQPASGRRRSRAIVSQSQRRWS